MARIKTGFHKFWEILKKNRKQLLRFMVVTVIGFVFLGIVYYDKYKPLDEILDYQVRVSPNEDGTLGILYRIKWKVLDDKKEGSLSWVKLGMGNTEYDVESYGGAISTRITAGLPYQKNDTYLNLYLDRPYNKGEIVDFWVRVRQKNMLCYDPEDSSQVLYQFIPGWFDHIKVDRYEFTWDQTDGLSSHSADQVQGDQLVWSGMLEPGGYREMKLYYDASVYADAVKVELKPFTKKSEADDMDWFRAILLGVSVLVIGANAGWGKGNYERGRGFHGYHGHHGNSNGGGGCACACAGCACACACAGGGRAGCSTKDFYKKKADKALIVDSEKKMEY